MAPQLESFALRNELNSMRNRLAALERNVSDGTYNEYTVTLTASSVDPSVGAGTLKGTYARYGDMVHALGDITFGAGMAAGTGQYRIGLPIIGADTTEAGADIAVGRWRCAQGGNTGEFSGLLVGAGLQYMTCRYSAAYPTGADTVVGAAAPWVWVSGGRISFGVLYRAAPY